MRPELPYYWIDHEAIEEGKRQAERAKQDKQRILDVHGVTKVQQHLGTLRARFAACINDAEWGAVHVFLRDHLRLLGQGKDCSAPRTPGAGGEYRFATAPDWADSQDAIEVGLPPEDIQERARFWIEHLLKLKARLVNYAAWDLARDLLEAYEQLIVDQPTFCEYDRLRLELGGLPDYFGQDPWWFRAHQNQLAEMDRRRMTAARAYANQRQREWEREGAERIREIRRHGHPVTASHVLGLLYMQFHPEPERDPLDDGLLPTGNCFAPPYYYKPR